VFAVSFDKSKVQWAIEQTNEDAAAQSAQASTDEELYSVVLPADGDTDGNITTGVVYFCVTDVSPELSETAAVDNVEASQTDLWIHEMARAGQFGSAVDPALTKMVQTGIVRTRVIDASQWLQAASDTPPLPLGLSPLTSATSVYGRLLRLTQAVLMPDASQYDLHLTVLLKGARGCGKRTVARWIAQKTGVHLLELNCYDLVGDTDARTEGVLRARIEQTVGCAPAILLLRHVEALARKSQALETGQEPTMATVLQNCLRDLRVPTSSLPILVLGTTGDAERCPTGVLACFRHELHFEAPNEAERAAILESCLAGSALSVDVNLKSIATQTAALVASDLVDLVGRAQLASIERVLKQDLGSGRRSTDQLDTAVSEAGVALCGSDFDTALAKARLSYSESIGAPKIPNVTWDDVGGLISVKDDIMDTIQLPLEHPELFVDGLKKRSGILLYGPPGTGKTLLAKAVATSCSLNFFSVKGPELLNMYIGESEANVRRVFQRARDAKPCVIFFDELDSIAPKRGNQGDSGGVMDRIVSQLLAELDGMSSGDGASDVFVIGATNRPDLLDPALLRPGRFDRMLYLAVSQTHLEQLNILQALTRKFKLDEDVGDLQVIAEQCPMNLTGADFYALCSDAMLKSMTRKAEWIDKQVTALNARAEATRAAGGQVAHPMPLTPQYYLDEMAAAADLDVKVAKADFEAALSELVPSVSAQEMAHYRTVQQRFSNTDTADTANDQEDAANARHSVKSDDRGGQLYSPMELDHGTVGQIIDAMQNAKTQNGHGKGGALMNGDRDPTNGDPDDRTQEQRRESKGKGRARE
jgi:peroxin-6